MTCSRFYYSIAETVSPLINSLSILKTFSHHQGSTNLIFAWTDFHAHKMVLRVRSATKKLRVHKTVTAGTTLYHLIYDVLTDIIFPIFCHHLNLKNISQAYAQHKGFRPFNWTSTGGLKIDQRRKLGQQKILRDIHSRIWFYFLMKRALLHLIFNFE